MGLQEPGFANTLAAAIDRQQLGLKQVQRRMAAFGPSVSLATLSYWRSGQRQPEGARSMAAVTALESALSMRAGELADLVGPTRRRRFEQEMPFDMQVGAARVGEVAFRGDHPRGRDPLVPRSRHVTVEVGIDGWVRRVTARSTWRARVSRVCRTPVYLKIDHPLQTPPDVVARAGCEIGSRHYDPATGLLTAELLLPHAVDRGDIIMTEHSVVGPMSSQKEHHWVLSASARHTEAGLRVEFDPARLPTACVLDLVDRASHLTRPLQMAEASVSHVVEGFGPGSVRISWGWPD